MKNVEERPLYVTYKDRVFRMLYSDRKKLLELYNALNSTDYTEEKDLIINTLENAIYIKMRNDISFVIGCNICLYEHQSSYCPNMPLRGLLYLTDIYKKMLNDVDLSVGRRIRIPTPHIIVFYNGLERNEEEFMQHLSESFEDDSLGCMELTVRTININFGKNQELLEKCRSLYEYSYFVATVREHMKNMQMKVAVEMAVDECIKKDILKEFLLEQKAEVIAMSIYEYNEEYVRKTFYEDGMEEGYTRGREEGADLFATLSRQLLKEGRTEDLMRATVDKQFRDMLYYEYEIRTAEKV
ncbi:MAG: hypothetical protein IJ485_03965 [Lachnospiraceae bacterium]|nr:hypothetical protein [Lachnospiraceae bacterium]